MGKKRVSFMWSRQVFLCIGFIGLFIIPLTVQADVLLTMKNGNSLKWSSFSLEDGNYCTWKTSGKFCLSQSDISSIKEVDSDSGSAPHQALGNAHQSTENNVPRRRLNSSSSGGSMTRSYGHENADVNAYSGGRGRYGTAGASYNRDASSTTYTKELSDADIGQLEYEESLRKRDAEERQLELERNRQLEEVKAAAREDKKRLEREEERQRRETERLKYR